MIMAVFLSGCDAYFCYGFSQSAAHLLEAPIDWPARANLVNVTMGGQASIAMSARTIMSATPLPKPGMAAFAIPVARSSSKTTRSVTLQTRLFGTFSELKFLRLRLPVRKKPANATSSVSWFSYLWAQNMPVN